MFTCIIGAGAKDNPCLKVTNPSIKNNKWESTLFYRLPQALESGKNYVLSMRIMFNEDDYGLPFWPCRISSDSSSSGTMYTTINKSFEKGKWTTITHDFTTTVEITSLQFAIGYVHGTFYIDDMVLVESGKNDNLIANGNFDEEVSHLICSADQDRESADAVESAIAPGTWWSWDNHLPEVTYLANAPKGTSKIVTIDHVKGGNLEGENTCLATKSNTGDNAGTMVYETFEGAGINGSNGAEVVVAPGASHSWDAQAWIVFDEEIAEGTNVEISFKCKATKDLRVNTQAHGNPGEYIDWNPIGYVDFTTEWQTYNISYSVRSGVKSIAFDLFQNQTEDVTVYFDDISVKEFKTVPVGELDADITTFSKSKLSGNEWNFAEPVDLSGYKYMVVTTVQSCGNMPGNMTITDANGVTVGNWDDETNLADNQIVYNKSAAGTRGKMRLDYSNNQNCACINLEYMSTIGLDLKAISNFTVPSAENISAIYLTNYTNGMAMADNCGSRVSGDHNREYKLLSEGKFGTVAFRYTAAVSGAKLYTVDSFDEELGQMVLAENVDGIAEAGVPYFYVACDFEGAYARNGQKGDNSDVYFFRVDGNAKTGVSTDEGIGNGLTGTYIDLARIWPDNSYILKNNRLVKVNSEVIILSNRCYFDASKYVGPQNQSAAKLVLGANSEETAIKNVDNTLNADIIYDMNGRKVKSMNHGNMYIMGGMKVYVK